MNLNRSLEYLLGNPSEALRDPGSIEGPIMSNIFTAKRDRILNGLSQATVAAASYRQSHGSVLCRSMFRDVV
jgi:hypothetical protein